jgi:hypothetical protein
MSMSKFSYLFAGLLGTLALSQAQAADFSDNSVGLRYGTKFSNPGTNDNNIHRTIAVFTHFSVDKLGTNFLNIDLLKSNGIEPAVGGGGGAQELTVGPTVSFDIPGFLEVGAFYYKETNHNGIVGKDVTFNAALKLGAAWSYDITPAIAFKGFIDFVGPKGTDGFGNKTKTETLSHIKLLADTGMLASGKKNGLLVGVGVEYWRNKFGNDPAKNPPGTTRETTPMLLAEYHF